MWRHFSSGGDFPRSQKRTAEQKHLTIFVAIVSRCEVECRQQDLFETSDDDDVNVEDNDDHGDGDGDDHNNDDDNDDNDNNDNDDNRMIQQLNKLGSGCGTLVEHKPHDVEVMDSNPSVSFPYYVMS